jgi:hypothetical protein
MNLVVILNILIYIYLLVFQFCFYLSSIYFPIQLSWYHDLEHMIDL